MKRFGSFRRLVLLLACGLAVAAIPLRAATSIYVKISNQNCGGMDRGFEGAFGAMTFSFGATNPEDAAAPTAGGTGAAPPQFGPAVIVKAFDQCTPKLLQLLAEGNHFDTVTISWVRTGGDAPFAFMTITLEQGFVKALSYGLAQESVSFDWRRMTLRYVTMRPDGSAGSITEFSWDRALNRAAA